MTKERPEPPYERSYVRGDQARQRRAVAQDEAFRPQWSRRARIWLFVELLLVVLLVALIAACVTIIDRPPAAPTIIEPPAPPAPIRGS